MTFEATIDIGKMLYDMREKEREDRWTLAFTGVCPHCKNAKGRRYDDRETGEIEWVPCHFCHSEEQLEDIERG